MSTKASDAGPVVEREKDGPDGRRRWAEWGVVGLLVSALIAFGTAPLLLPESYSWVEHGISESAAQGIEEAWPARLGFICFGLAVVWLVGLRTSSWGPAASLFHLVFGVCMFAVAAFSARSWEPDAPFVEQEDLLHSLFATVMGFGFIAGVATLIVVRGRRSVWAAVPDGWPCWWRSRCPWPCRSICGAGCSEPCFSSPPPGAGGRCRRSALRHRSGRRWLGLPSETSRQSGPRRTGGCRRSPSAP